MTTSYLEIEKKDNKKEHILIGFLIGGALSLVIVGTLAYDRIEANRMFADEMAQKYLTTLEQLEALKKKEEY